MVLKHKYFLSFQIRETSLILKRIQLNNCDVRFRQSVERFSLQIFVEQFKIQPMGLLEINISLMHDVSWQRFQILFSYFQRKNSLYLILVARGKKKQNFIKGTCPHTQLEHDPTII